MLGCAAARQSLKARPLHAPTLILADRIELAAIPLLRAAIQAEPDRHEATFLLCQALAATGDPGLADTLQALALQVPAQAKRWLALGLKLRETAALPAARAALRLATQVKESEIAWFALGLTCQDLN